MLLTSLDNEEVGFTLDASVTDSSQKEPSDSVLIKDNFFRHPQHPPSKSPQNIPSYGITDNCYELVSAVDRSFRHCPVLLSP